MIVSGEYIGLHSQYYMNMHSLSSSLLSLVTTSSSNDDLKCQDTDISGEQRIYRFSFNCVYTCLMTYSYISIYFFSRHLEFSGLTCSPTSSPTASPSASVPCGAISKSSKALPVKAKAAKKIAAPGTFV